MTADLVLTPQPGLAYRPGPGGGGHWYLQGRECSGVTTATSVYEKWGLKGWAAECAADFIRERLGGFVEKGEAVPPAEFERVLAGAKFAYRDASRRARTRGTKVDEWVNGYIADRITCARQRLPMAERPRPDKTEEPQARRSVDAFLAWEDDHDVEFVAFQHAAADPRFLIVGVSDFWVVLGHGSHRRAWLGDTKSSKSYETWFDWEMQLAGNLAVAYLGGTISGPLAGDVIAWREWLNGRTDRAPEDVIGRGDLIVNTLTGEPRFVQVTQDVRTDWQHILRGKGARPRVPRERYE